MAAATDEAGDVTAVMESGGNRRGRKKLLLLAVPLLVCGLGAGLWFTGVLPKLLGMAPHKTDAEAGAAVKPVFVEVPEMITNLSVGPRRQSYVKLKAQIELTRAADAPVLTAAMPRVVDLFQTYLREMSPEELRGSAGTYRLREELISRVNTAITPAQASDVLFTEILVQ